VSFIQLASVFCGQCIDMRTSSDRSKWKFQIFSLVNNPNGTPPGILGV